MKSWSKEWELNNSSRTINHHKTGSPLATRLPTTFSATKNQWLTRHHF